MGKIKAVIFDLDGTLLDTLDDLADSMNRVLNKMGFPTHPRESYKYFVGDGIEKLAYRVLPEQRRSSQEIADCVSAMKEEYLRHWQDKTRVYRGVEEMLSELGKRNIRLSIFSNKPDEFTQLAVTHYFPRQNFAQVRGIKEGIPKKPDPAGALQIMKELALEPADFVYLGDTNTDMLTAKGAGIFAIGALWGFRNREELINSGAQALIENPEELISYV